MSLHVYCNKNLRHQHIFVGLPTISGRPTAEVFHGVIVDTLKDRLGLQDADLRRKLMQFSCDGPTVLLGRHRGVGARIRTQCPFDTVAHRVDLVAKSMARHNVMQQATSIANAPATFCARNNAHAEKLKEV